MPVCNNTNVTRSYRIEVEKTGNENRSRCQFVTTLMLLEVTELRLKRNENRSRCQFVTTLMLLKVTELRLKRNENREKRKKSNIELIMIRYLRYLYRLIFIIRQISLVRRTAGLVVMSFVRSRHPYSRKQYFAVNDIT
jgi:hypothetical protein